MKLSTQPKLSLYDAGLLNFGLLTAAVAAFSDRLGLGSGQEFLLFRLFYLERGTVFRLGLMLMLAGSIHALWRGLGHDRRQKLFDEYLQAAAVHCEVLAAKRPASRFVWPFLVQILLASIVAGPMFWLNRGDIMGYIDGHYLLTLSNNRAEFAAVGPVFSSNPLQGLGDLWYMTGNTQWIPELAIMRFFSDPEWRRVAVHLTSFVEIFTVVAFFGYWLFRSAGRALASAWLAVLLITPLTTPQLLYYNCQADNPEFTTLITFPLIVTPLWASIGRGSFAADIGGGVCIGVLFWFHLIAIGLASLLDFPFVGIAGCAFLVASWRNQVEFRRKVCWGLGLLVFFTVSGLPQIFLGLITDSAFHIFQEMARSDRDLSLGSILLRPQESLGMMLGYLGLAGAAFQSAFGSGRIRCVAIATVTLGALILGASVGLKLGLATPAIPIYYEIALWGIYPIFAISLIAAICDLACSRLTGAFVHPTSAVRMLLWITVPILAIISLHGPNYWRGMHNDRPNIFPPRPTAISDFLQREIGIGSRTTFRGRVATITGQNLPSRTDWDELFGIDMKLLTELGNDHRTIGMWYYNIPTLTEFTITTPPLMYILVKRYLAYNGDVQGRHILSMRRPNAPILQLLGVRYVISDSLIPILGGRRVIELPLPHEDGRLALDELPSPNLGLSPTEIIQIPDGEALNWLGNNANDYSREALLAGPLPGNLKVAQDITINVLKGGVHVRAISTGSSLVVLPFQYSHCLEVVPAAASKAPDLRRADVLFTGLLFDRTLDVEIRYRQGPFENTDCRLNDQKDDVAFAQNF